MTEICRSVVLGSLLYTRRLFAVVMFVLCSVCMYAVADKQYGVDDVPNVRLQDARQYVCDPSQILSPVACDSINGVLARLEKSTGIETAVVMLPSIGDNDIMQFSVDLFRKWGIGKKKSDNGLLILFVMDQHKVRFATGYGIEGTMTDAMSKRIQMQVMVPRFKQADWDGGMVNGVRAVAKVLDGSMKAEADNDDIDASTLAVIMLLLIVGGSIFVIYIIGTQQRCPKCRKRGALRKVDSVVLRMATGISGHDKKIRRTTYICKYCGHVVTKDENIDDSNDAFLSGAIIGSMLGSHRSGGYDGGSFGGSFGGGSTGGGGSTSSW